MRLSAPQLQSNPRVFRHFTGLTPTEFDTLVADVLPELASRDHARLNRPNRQRAIGGGTPFTLTPRDQCLLTVIWLRVYLMHECLGFLFGISHPTVGRIISRILPILEQLGRDGMRRPDPGKRRRPSLDQLLADTPEFAVIVDSWEQPVQRPQDRTEADTYYSGKKKQHTHKTQIAVDETTGGIVALSDPVRGPTADLTLLKDSTLLATLPPGVGVLGDLAYVGVGALHPQGLGATPRRKPRGQDRPADDIAYNQAFARRRIVVEHTIGRMRRYQAVTQRDRHHRQHRGRGHAIAGLVNRCVGRKRV